MKTQIKFLCGINNEDTRKQLKLAGGTKVDVYLLPDGTLVVLKNDLKEDWRILRQKGFRNFDLKIEKEEDLCDQILREWKESSFI